VTIVLAVPPTAGHARELAARLGASAIVPEVRRFPDGELYVRIDADLAGQDVVLAGAATDFLAIAFLAGTARDLGARRVGLVAPYLPYLRQDDRFHPGEGVTATYFARLVSGTVDWLVTVDPHLHRLAALDRVYSIPTTIARAAPAIAAWVAASIERPILVGPDAESAQWVAAVAEGCGAPYVILEKTRRGDRDVSVSAPTRELAGHSPVLVDDIVSTGKTMLEAARQVVAAGGVAPMCVAIHAVFADAVDAELLAAGARGIVTCDTIAHATNGISVGAAIADAVRGYLV
jgi:ribose-phosphate pyrophosphokinase